MHQLAKEGRWPEIVAEKRAALQQIKHTLDTYHRLLTQAPVPADGVLKMLQSVVRCVSSLPLVVSPSLGWVELRDASPGQLSVVYNPWEHPALRNGDRCA